MLRKCVKLSHTSFPLIEDVKRGSVIRQRIVGAEKMVLWLRLLCAALEFELGLCLLGKMFKPDFVEGKLIRVPCFNAPDLLTHRHGTVAVACHQDAVCFSPTSGE